MVAKGGAAEDIARPTRGDFYFSRDGFGCSVKIHPPLCLNWRSVKPPIADEIVQKARARQGFIAEQDI
jgi:hypothetical protein